MVGTTQGGLYFTNSSSDYFNGSFDVSVVPEPATFALAALAGIGVVAARLVGKPQHRHPAGCRANKPD